jgi:hypothetical protein
MSCRVHGHAVGAGGHPLYLTASHHDYGGTLFELTSRCASRPSLGGVGSVFGSLIGALVMGSLTSGMNLMGADISMQYIARACVGAGGIFDATTRRRGLKSNRPAAPVHCVQ